MDFSLDCLREQIIGRHALLDTPYGRRLLTYADYTASGRCLRFIEEYLMSIEAYYANTHSEDSYTGKAMTELVNLALENIKRYVHASTDYYIIPTGTGATGAIAKLCQILGLYLTPPLKFNLDALLHGNRELITNYFKTMETHQPIIFVGPYEHHSNYLIWKESFATVIEINLSGDGTIDLFDLEKQLNNLEWKDRLKIGSFSAASNITGVKSDVLAIARLMHRYEGLVFFDYAASAPYVDIDMNHDEESYFDALFLAPHKLLGGPGSSGMLLFNKKLYNRIYSPTVAGGGTVSFVNSCIYQFSEDVETREKAGTPGILQILKASLAFELKDKVGVKTIEAIESYYIKTAIERLSKHPNIILLGPKEPEKRIAILSFNIKHENGLLHYKFVATLLNDLFGIQARSGCACAGPYAHRLLGISDEFSKAIQRAVNEGVVSLKPGFVRVNFHYTIEPAEFQFLLDSITWIASYGYLFLQEYEINLQSGNWTHRFYQDSHTLASHFGIAEGMKPVGPPLFINHGDEFRRYFEEATQYALLLQSSFSPSYRVFLKPEYESMRWFHFTHVKYPDYY